MRKPIEIPANSAPWAKEIVDAMNKQEVNMRQLSELCRLGETYVRDMLKRGREPTISKMRIIKQALGIGEEGTQFAPFYGTVSAGGLQKITQRDTVDMLNVGPLPHPDCFILEVEGRSMLKIAVDGSYIIVDPRQKTLVDDYFYIFTHEDAATFKRYKPSPHRLEPYTFDNGFETIFPDNEPMPIGRVIKVITDL